MSPVHLPRARIIRVFSVVAVALATCAAALSPIIDANAADPTTYTVVGVSGGITNPVIDGVVYLSMQGAATDGTYGYFIKVSGGQVPAIIKIRMSDKKPVDKGLAVLKKSHANGLGYDSSTKMLMYADGRTIYFVDPVGLKVDESKTAIVNHAASGGLCYNAEHGYVLGAANGSVQSAESTVDYYLYKTLKYEPKTPLISTSLGVWKNNDLAGSIACDADRIYIPRAYRVDTGEWKNRIEAYDWSGGDPKETYDLKAPVDSDEIQGIFLYGGKAWVNFNRGNNGRDPYGYIAGLTTTKTGYLTTEK